MTKKSTDIHRGTGSVHSLAQLVSCRIAYWKKQLRSRAALRSLSNEINDARLLADVSCLDEEYTNNHRDNSMVGNFRKHAAGRSLLGLAMAVGPSLGGQ